MYLVVENVVTRAVSSILVLLFFLTAGSEYADPSEYQRAMTDNEAYGYFQALDYKEFPRNLKEKH